jgi:hypothetical protein
VISGDGVGFSDVAEALARASVKVVCENRVAVADSLAFTGFDPRAAHVIAARSIYLDVSFRPLPLRVWGEGEPTDVSL